MIGKDNDYFPIIVFILNGDYNKGDLISTRFDEDKSVVIGGIYELDGNKYRIDTFGAVVGMETRFFVTQLK